MDPLTTMRYNYILLLFEHDLGSTFNTKQPTKLDIYAEHAEQVTPEKHFKQNLTSHHPEVSNYKKLELKHLIITTFSHN